MDTPFPSSFKFASQEWGTSRLYEWRVAYRSGVQSITWGAAQDGSVSKGGWEGVGSVGETPTRQPDESRRYSGRILPIWD